MTSRSRRQTRRRRFGPNVVDPIRERDAKRKAVGLVDVAMDRLEAESIVFEAHMVGMRTADAEDAVAAHRRRHPTDSWDRTRDYVMGLAFADALLTRDIYEPQR